MTEVDSDATTELRLQLAQAKAEKAGLLDIINAILKTEGGEYVVPRAHMMAATRDDIVVIQQKDHVVVKTKMADQGETATPGKSLLERLWLPGRS